LADFLKGSSVALQRCFQLGLLLPAEDSYVDISRLVLKAIRDPSGFLSGEDGCPGARKLVEHDIAACRAIEKGIRNQRQGFDSRVGRKRLHAVLAEGVHASIGPHVRSVPSETAEFDIISMGTTSGAKDANEFVL
jgi:hypothetical protein